MAGRTKRILIQATCCVASTYFQNGAPRMSGGSLRIIGQKRESLPPSISTTKFLIMAEPSRLVPELGAGADITYPDTQLFINGEWCDAASGGTKGGTNPATGGLIGRVAQATKADLDRALTCRRRRLSRMAAHNCFGTGCSIRQGRRTSKSADRDHCDLDDPRTRQAASAVAQRA